MRYCRIPSFRDRLCSELINFCSPGNHQMISGATEVNQFAPIRLILEAKFGDDSLFILTKVVT